MKKFDLYFAFAQICIDFCAIVFGLLVAYCIRMFGYDLFSLEAPITLIPFFSHFGVSLKIAFLMIFLFGINGRYNVFTHFKSQNLFQSFWSFSAGIGIVVVIFFFNEIHFFSRFILGFAWVLGFLFLILGETFLKYVQKKLWQKGMGRIRILLLGSGSIAKKIKLYLSEHKQFSLVDHITESRFSSLQNTIQKISPDEIVLASEKTSGINVAEIAHLAHLNHVSFSFVPDELALDLVSVQPFQIQGMPLLQINPTKITGWGKIAKGFVDRIFAFCALVFLSPIFLVLCFLIWKEDKSFSFVYASPRVGKNGVLFNCYKFRSMVENADSLKAKLIQKNEKKGGVLFKIKDDPRVTKIGKILRKWSLDELPQLFNVLKGEMSLIGPRPHLPEEVSQYSETHRYLFNIKPGITGLTQIQKSESGELGFEQEMKVELFYLKNWTPWIDLLIFVRTLGVIFGGRNF